MSSSQHDNHVDIASCKQPFSVSQLIPGLLLGTYFLTVETIELSLSIYTLQQNNLDIYRQYLIFKSQAPIWKHWQLFTVIIMPLTVTMITRDLFQTLTKKASTERHLLDILAACQLFSILYAIIVHVMPLENQFMEKPSKDIARDLNVVHWITFILNILGWIIPVLRSREIGNEKHIKSREKTE